MERAQQAGPISLDERLRRVEASLIGWALKMSEGNKSKAARLLQIMQPPLDRWHELIQTEYREMPGLHLTKPQIRRMWNLDVTTCDAVLDALEHEKFLRRTPEHAYVLESMSAC